MSPSRPHSGIPLWHTEGFGRWDLVTSRAPWPKPCRFDGSSQDYWEFLRRAERLAAPLSGGARTRVGYESNIGIAPSIFVSANVSYWLRAAKDAAFYMLDEGVVEAIASTRLTWVDAEAFATLPDAFGILIEQPGPGLQLYSSSPDGDWHDVSDILLLRVKDPDNRARLCDNLRVDPADPAIQIFTWIAGSLHGDRGSLNWGVFHVSGDMRLNQLSDGLEDLLARLTRQAQVVGPVRVEEPKRAKQSTRDFVREVNALNESVLRDYTEGADQQRASMANLVNFLAKVVLLSNCDWFKPLLEKVPPPGARAMPHKARKLWDLYGNRMRVHLPAPDDEGDGGAADAGGEDAAHHGHRSPVRHRVEGFFRNQPYGTGRTLRKVIWIQPFWRGRTIVGQAGGR